MHHLKKLYKEGKICLGMCVLHAAVYLCAFVCAHVTPVVRNKHIYNSRVVFFCLFTAEGSEEKKWKSNL